MDPEGGIEGWILVQQRVSRLRYHDDTPPSTPLARFPSHRNERCRLGARLRGDSPLFPTALRSSVSRSSVSGTWDSPEFPTTMGSSGLRLIVSVLATPPFCFLGPCDLDFWVCERCYFRRLKLSDGVVMVAGGLGLGLDLDRMDWEQHMLGSAYLG